MPKRVAWADELEETEEVKTEVVVSTSLVLLQALVRGYLTRRAISHARIVRGMAEWMRSGNVVVFQNCAAYNDKTDRPWWRRLGQVDDSDHEVYDRAQAADTKKGKGKGKP